MIKLGAAAAFFGLLILVNCADEPPIIAETNNVDRFAQQVLNAIQPASIAESREYCGYIYETEDGGLAATAPVRGATDYCDLPDPDETVIASYHSHGGFSPDFDNEVPSVDDLLGDFEAGIDGYVGTPAGRVWHNDVETETTTQLCSVACIIADPEDDPAQAGLIPDSFTLSELRARFE